MYIVRHGQGMEPDVEDETQTLEQVRGALVLVPPKGPQLSVGRCIHARTYFTERFFG